MEKSFPKLKTRTSKTQIVLFNKRDSFWLWAFLFHKWIVWTNKMGEMSTSLVVPQPLISQTSSLQSYSWFTYPARSGCIICTWFSSLFLSALSSWNQHQRHQHDSVHRNSCLDVNYAAYPFSTINKTVHYKTCVWKDSSWFNSHNPNANDAHADNHMNTLDTETCLNFYTKCWHFC